MRHTFLYLLALLAMAPHPAIAGINPAAVANCLGRHAAQPDRCLPVVFQPCKGAPTPEHGACVRGITFEWLRLSELRTQMLLQRNKISPGSVSHKPLTNEMLMDIPGCEVSSYRQGVIDTRDLDLSLRLCTLLAVARTWHVVEANPEGALSVFRTFIVRQELLKSCVAKSAPSGLQNDCIGRISDRCAKRFSQRLCDDQEAILWEAILTNAYAALGPDAAKALLANATRRPIRAEDCQKDLDRCARALRDQNAERAMILYLALDR